MGKMNIMKHIILAAALSLAATTAFAGATTTAKDTGSQGSNVGQASSSYTGNGAAIGGNGDTSMFGRSVDQTTAPGSRSDEVHSVQGGTGPGNSSNSPGHNR
jgi:hypothetical protein